MTVAAEGARSGWGRRLLWATLAVSLVINIFFVGTMVWLRMNAEPRAVWPALVHAIGSHLKVKEEKNEAFKRLVMETRQNTRLLHNTNQPLIVKMWEELGKPQTDPEAVNHLVDQITENRRAYEKTMTSAFAKFRADLPAGQRQEVDELVRDRLEQRGQHLRRLVLP
jgi:uncharacterized membrane protein